MKPNDKDGAIPIGDEQEAGRGQTALRALEHALDRLNAIPHRYADTDFRLIAGTIGKLKAWRSPVALVVIKGGAAEILEHEPTCIRIVDLDNIQAGDPPVELPAGIGFEELVKKAGLDRKAVRFIKAG